MLWKNNSAPTLQECIKTLSFNKYNKRTRVRLISYHDLSINSSKFSKLLLQANLLQLFFCSFENQHIDEVSDHYTFSKMLT